MDYLRKYSLKSFSTLRYDPKYRNWKTFRTVTTKILNKKIRFILQNSGQ